ncbi:MAG: ROK family transcriptional regulator [Xanthobacteraceae bacterium]
MTDESSSDRDGPPSVKARPPKGSNIVLVGDFNERVVLSTLRRYGRASTADLSRLVGLTHNATGMIVKKLESGGLVRQLGKRYGGRGQPATVLELNPDGAYSIGVRVDRTKIEVVLVDLCGTILDRRMLHRLPMPAGTMAYLVETIGGIRDALGEARRQRLKGIGVAIPYNLGSWLRELDLPVRKFRIWNDFDIGPALTRATDLSVFVENDGNAAAAAELIYGHGRQLANFLYLFVGPVIGGGLVLDSDYQRGETGNAGDVAVMPVEPSRLASSSAAGAPRTFLMTRASLNALERHYAHHGIDASADRNIEAVVAGFPRAFDEWLEDACDALAMPVLTSVHLLDIAHVVIDSDLPPALLARLIERLGEVTATTVAESRNPPTLLRGSLGLDAAAVGAATLPLHMTYNPMPALLTAKAPQRA